MPTTQTSFVYNKLQAVNNPSNTIAALPNLLALEGQSALQMSGRLQGGTAYRGNSAVVAPNTTNAAVLVDGMETLASRLGYAKNGAFLVITNGAAVTVPLTNTATNTNGTAGDTVFAQCQQYTVYNLSGLDGNNSVNGTFGTATTNGAGLGLVNGTALTIAGSSRFVGENCATNGWAIAAATANVILNSATACTWGIVVSGS